MAQKILGNFPDFHYAVSVFPLVGVDLRMYFILKKDCVQQILSYGKLWLL